VHTHDLMLWFQKIEQRFHGLRRNSIPGSSHVQLNALDARGWVTDASSALEAVFPPSHACLRDWRKLAESIMLNYMSTVDINLLFAIFQPAHGILKDGHLSTLIDAVRAEFESPPLRSFGRRKWKVAGLPRGCTPDEPTKGPDRSVYQCGRGSAYRLPACRSGPSPAPHDNLDTPSSRQQGHDLYASGPRAGEFVKTARPHGACPWTCHGSPGVLRLY